MGDCKRKGEAYLAQVAEDQEMTVLKAIYQIEGAESLDKNQRRKLRLAGVIKKRRGMQYNDSSMQLLNEFKNKHHSPSSNKLEDVAVKGQGSLD